MKVEVIKSNGMFMAQATDSDNIVEASGNTEDEAIDNLVNKLKEEESFKFVEGEDKISINRYSDGKIFSIQRMARTYSGWTTVPKEIRKMEEDKKRRIFVKQIVKECNFRTANTCRNCIYIKYIPDFCGGMDEYTCLKPENELMSVWERGICDYFEEE